MTCVVLLAVLPPVWGVAVRAGGPPRAVVATLLAVNAMVAVLLATTPADAIRLRVGRSIVWVVGLTAWAYGLKAATIGAWPQGVGVAIVATAAAGFAAWVFARRSLSPWWAGVIVWAAWALW